MHGMEKRGEQAMNNHNRKIEYAEAVLIMNLEKNGVAGYIGSNTLLEMGLAFIWGRRFICLHPFPISRQRKNCWACIRVSSMEILSKLCF